jgi:fructose-1,6-bisphosphatase-3
MEALRAASQQYPSAAAAIAEVAALRAELLLPMEAVHIIGDVHGEYAKLRQVLHSASGRLRPLVDRLFTSRLPENDRHELLNVLHFPRDEMERQRDWLSKRRHRHTWSSRMLRRQFELVREMSGQRRLGRVLDLFPQNHRQLFAELFAEPLIRWEQNYVEAMINTLIEADRDLDAVSAASQLVRNLAYAELVVAGDLGDRGPRIDRVIDDLRRQPNVLIVWGNHDVQWMGASLGHAALIAAVLRLSTQHNRLAQLEEGYGISLGPLEKLARDVYGDDPCPAFAAAAQGDGPRDAALLARMHKAAAMVQFKLDAHVPRRHPQWDFKHRHLLHKIDHAAGTINIDGKTYPLVDRHWPTLNTTDPYTLSDAERSCVEQMHQAFVGSAKLRQDMQWLADHGRMWLRRGDALVFHAGVPVDASGNPLTVAIDGKDLGGRALMDGLEAIVRKTFAAGDGAGQDADWLWYLCNADRSPLLGKDKLATFEQYFVEDHAARREKRNPYFQLIHDAAFCRKIGQDFGAGDDVLLVSAHLPVRLERDDTPLKRNDHAVSLDGAFGQTHRDHGYTLVLDCTGIKLVKHSQFDSVQEILVAPDEKLPQTTSLRQYDPPRTMADGQRGALLREKIALLRRLLEAYQNKQVPQYE